MRILSLLTLFFLTISCYSQTPSLGNYPATVIATAGGNAVINPFAPPISATSATAYTSTNFKGILQVNPSTGVVRITNAYPAGTYTVTVKAFNGASVATNTFILTVNNATCSQGLLGGSTELQAGLTQPQEVAIGDFNNDGKQDFVVTNYSNSGGANVFFGNGTGGFIDFVRVITYNNALMVSVADFNNDGNQDLAISSESYGKSVVSVYLGNGVGGFSGFSEIEVRRNSNNAKAMIVADFNGDGKQDLATSTGYLLLVCLGDGLGTFNATTEISISNLGLAMVAGDFNKDGKIDLALANYTAAGSVSIWLGNGVGGFTAGSLIAVGSYPKAIVTADFNKDGNPDFATANYAAGTVSVRLGNGAGGFIQSQDFVVSTTANSAASLIVADLNGDGNLDLGVNKTSAITVLLGTGAGLFYDNGATPVINRSQTLALADFNNDGRGDFLAAGSDLLRSVSICLGKASTSTINLLGNNNNIYNTDNIPSLSDNTDFGNTSNNISRNFTIQNSGIDTLMVTAISINGVDSNQFIVTGINLPAKLPVGGSTTFSVSFTPTSTGLKTAVVNILNGDCNKLLFYYSIQATGVVIMPVPPTYPINSTIAAGGNITITPTSSPNSTLSFVATAPANFRGTLTVNPATGIVNITNASPAGTYTIRLKAINGFSSATTSFPLTVTNTATCSVPGSRSLLSFSAGAAATAIGDFNGDGKQDFVTTLATASLVAVRLGDGAGGFTGTTTVAVGFNPTSIAVADFNGDGKLDFITSSYAASGSVSVRLGDGLGGFTGTTAISMGGYLDMITLADFNNDNKIDFAVVNGTNGTVLIRLGDGVGSFFGTTAIAVGNNPRSITVADVNNDGNADILISNYTGVGTVSVRLGNGSGSFTNAPDVTTANGASYVATGDLNGDGNADIVNANLPNNTISVCIGNGNGGFRTATTLPAGNQPKAVAFADFDSDGKQDVIISSLTDSITIWHGDGQGNLIRPFKGVASYGTIAIGDFNNDGKLDVLSTSGSSNIAICLGSSNDITLTGNGTTIPTGANNPSLSDYTEFGTVSGTTRTYTIKSTGPSNLTIGSITLSGIGNAAFKIGGIILPKVLPADSTTTFTVTFTPASTGVQNAQVNIGNDNCTKSIYTFAVKGTATAPTIGTYSNSAIVSASANTSIIPSVAPTNLQSITATTSPAFKGTLQVNATTGVLYITNAHPAGTYQVNIKAYNGLLSATATTTITVNSYSVCSQNLFTRYADASVGGRPSSTAIADFNNDGKQDFAALNINAAVAIKLGDGTGAFSGNTLVAVGQGASSLAVADFNGDGNQDFVTANSTSNTASVRLGNGNGGFTAAVEVPAGIRPGFALTGDFNRDNKPDFAISNNSTNTVSIYLGDGLGNFVTYANVSVACPSSMAIGDFNRDSIPDIVVTQTVFSWLGIQSVAILKGNGSGGFTSNGPISVGSIPLSVAVGDFDNDGKQDWVVANNYSSDLSVGYGDGTGNFSVYTNLGAGSPYAVAVADLNGDGKQDIVAIGSSGVYYYPGTGTRTFAQPLWNWNTTLPSSGTTTLSIGDLNGDGKQDLLLGKNVDSVSSWVGSNGKLQVKGNGQLIVNGSITPSFSDSTDLGTTGYLTTTRLSLKSAGTGRLTIQSVSLSGGDSAMFNIQNLTASRNIEAGDSFILKIDFLPTSSGLKKTTVRITTDECGQPQYIFAIQGAGSSVPVTLGIYNADTMLTGGNKIITPANAPVNVPNLTATASTCFTGKLHADPITGKVFITNAGPAGTYTITTKAHGVATATSSFVLVVNNSGCSNISPITDIPGGNYPNSITIGDFNNDGKQDMAVANLGANLSSISSASIRLGDGLGGFADNGSVNVGIGQSILTTADFNGDGKADLAVASDVINILSGDGNGRFTQDRTISLQNNLSCLATGDFNGDGKIDLLSGGPFNPAYLHLGNGSGGFNTIPNVSGTQYAYIIATADINKDNNLDFATIGFNENAISVYLGDGNGSFTSKPSVPVVGVSQKFSFADFNGDGNPDIISISSDSSIATICLGDGNGNFPTFITRNIEPNAGGLATSDFNGDGKLDFAVSTSTYTSNSLSVYYNNGLADFSRISKIPIDPYASTLTVGDFNGDGMQDMLTPNSNSNGSTISILLGKANAIAVKGNNKLIAADDNTPDSTDFTDFGVTNSLTRPFVIQNTGTGYLTIYSIAINGSDSALFALPVLNLPITLAPGGSTTFNVRFLPVSVGLKTATVNILTNNCNRSLYSFTIQGTGVTPVLGDYSTSAITTAGGNISITPTSAPMNATNIVASTSASFKGILRVEQTTGKVVITNAYPAGVYTILIKANGISTPKNFILTVTDPNCSKGLFMISPNSSIGGIGSGAGSVAIMDYNGDGKQDFATGNFASNTVSIRYGNGRGSYDYGTNVPVGSGPTSIAVSDFNDDGWQDIIVTNYGSNSASICLGDAGSTFGNVINIPVGNNPQTVVVADFNGDYNTDFATTNYGSNTISIRLGNGSGGFTSLPDISTGNNPYGLATGDFNRDGRPDMLVANATNSSISVLLGDGTGGFNNTSTIGSSGSLRCVTTADFNNDGWQDFAVANSSGNSVAVYTNNGNATFTSSSSVAVGTSPIGIATGDFNGDSKQDIAVANYGSNYVSVRLGNGAGSFTNAPDVIVTGSTPVAIATADYNNDGRQDLVFPYYATNIVAIRVGVASDINLQGNNTNIVNGSNTALITNYTAFGTVNVTSSLTRTYTIQNTGSSDLVVSDISITGNDSAQFTRGNITLPLTITTGASVIFNVTFSPTSTGTKLAWVNIVNDDCDEATYRFAIKGGPDSAAVLHFDGINDYISINNTVGNFGNSDASIAAWIKTSTTIPVSIVSKGNTCSNENFIDFAITAAGRLSAKFGESISNYQSISGKALINNDVWHHVAVIRKSDTLTLYVDGLIDTTTVFSNIAAVNNTGQLLLGASDCNAISNFFNGRMDEVKIYNRPLSMAEIQSHIHCELNGAQNSLLAYYKFNQGFVGDSNTTTTTLIDSSGNSNNGFLNNFSLSGLTSNWVAQGPVVSSFSCINTSMWLGITSAWNNPSNWSSGFVPSEMTKVIINTGVPWMPEITGNEVCYKLTLNNGASIKLKSSGHLEIVGKN